MTREMTFAVREKEAGAPLSVFLARRFTYHTREEWVRLISEGRVTLNGRSVAAETPLRAEDVLRYDASGIPEPPVDEAFDVVHDDPLLMIVNKSGNLPCHPGGRYFRHTLWAFLKTRHGLADPVLVNRLDRETSGLVLIAKTQEAAQNLWRQFAAHSVVKRYTVFVEGLFPERLAAAGWLVSDTRSQIRKKRRFAEAAPGEERPEPGAEWAETSFERLRLCDGFSALCASPKTGRLHQIRATLFSLGYPVTGDKLYGLDETLFLRFCRDELTDGDRQLLRLPRQALHADYLRFRHPKYGALTEISVPLSTDMRVLLRD